MSSPQTLINFNVAAGLPGTVAYDVPVYSQNRIIDSSVLGIPNSVGYAYTETVVGGVAVATAGGTGEFAGILIEPKAYSNPAVAGTSNYAIANGSVGHLLNHGAVFVAVPAACAIGDEVLFSQATGAISTQPRVASFTGAIAVTTGILTVSAIVAGASIVIGEELYGTGVPVGTLITGFLTGTNGGIGTYSTNVITAVASTATLTSVASVPTGYTKIRNAKVDYFGLTAAGVAVIKIIGV